MNPQEQLLSQTKQQAVEAALKAVLDKYGYTLVYEEIKQNGRIVMSHIVAAPLPAAVSAPDNVREGLKVDPTGAAPNKGVSDGVG